MLRVLWEGLVVCSLVGLICYLGLLLFRNPSDGPMIQDPYEALLKMPTSSFEQTNHDGVKKEIGEEKIETPVIVVNSNPSESLSKSSSESDSNFLGQQLDAKSKERMNNQNPHEVLGSIEEELSQLPGGADSAPARASLLHTVSKLDVDQDDAETVHELALNELFQKLDPQDIASSQSTSFAYFLPVLAHEIALKTAYDGVEAMQITIDGLSVQDDPGIRHSLIKNFVLKYPEYEPHLKEELYLRNISDEIADAAVPSLSTQ